MGKGNLAKDILIQRWNSYVTVGIIKILSGTSLLILLLLSGCKQNLSYKIFDNPYPDIDEFAMTSDDCILEGRHLWISNEIQTVNPDLTGIGGISKIYSPPLNLSPFQMEVKFFE